MPGKLESIARYCTLAGLWLAISACGPIDTDIYIEEQASSVYVDAGVEEGVDAGAAGADAGRTQEGECGGCGQGTVCCPDGLPCAGQCVPDCRVDDRCPDNMVCEQQSGLCAPGEGPPPADGGGPPPADGGAGESCLEGAQCDQGTICCPADLPCAGMCVPDCRSFGQCPEGAACDSASGLCVPEGAPPVTEPEPVPEPPAPTSCVDGLACEAGAICCPAELPCAGQCLPDCRSTGQCPEGMACDGASGLCAPEGEPPAPTSCVEGMACAAGAICCPAELPCAGQCVPDCRATGQCPPGGVCDGASGLCVPGGPPPAP